MPKLKQRYGVKIKGETLVWRDGAVVSLNGAKLSNPLGDVPNTASIDRHKRQVGQANVSYVNQSENSSKSQEGNSDIVLVNEKSEAFGHLVTQFPQTQNKPNAFLRGAYLWSTPKGLPIDSSQQAFLPKVKRGNFSSFENQETQSENSSESQSENSDNLNPDSSKRLDVGNVENAINEADVEAKLESFCRKKFGKAYAKLALAREGWAEFILDVPNENPDVKKEATFGFFFCRIIN